MIFILRLISILNIDIDTDIASNLDIEYCYWHWCWILMLVFILILISILLLILVSILTLTIDVGNMLYWCWYWYRIPRCYPAPCILYLLSSLNSKFNVWPETTLANTSTNFNKTRSHMCSGSSVGPVLAEACSTTQQYQSKPGSTHPP